VRNILVLGSLALAAMVWSGVSAQQEMLSRPGPGSGVSKVSGTVTIDEMPDVNAKQRGPWRVGITDMPEIHVAGPAFVRPGGRYDITWEGGDKESLVVSSIGADGWVKVEHQRSRWVNLGLARSVEAMN
jgi:hypothetical protein